MIRFKETLSCKRGLFLIVNDVEGIELMLIRRARLKNSASDINEFNLENSSFLTEYQLKLFYKLYMRYTPSSATLYYHVCWYRLSNEEIRILI